MNRVKGVRDCRTPVRGGRIDDNLIALLGRWCHTWLANSVATMRASVGSRRVSGMASQIAGMRSDEVGSKLTRSDPGALNERRLSLPSFGCELGARNKPAPRITICDMNPIAQLSSFEIIPCSHPLISFTRIVPLSLVGRPTRRSSSGMLREISGVEVGFVVPDLD
jgi:hypothetical protein